MAGHKDVTDNWDEFSKLLWEDSYWADKTEAKSVLKAAVDAAVMHLATPEEKTKKARNILSQVSGGLSIVKGVLGF